MIGWNLINGCGALTNTADPPCLTDAHLNNELRSLTASTAGASTYVVNGNCLFAVVEATSTYKLQHTLVEFGYLCDFQHQDTTINHLEDGNDP